MSKIKHIFKPKINGVIAGLAVAAFIIAGSYLAYRNGIFASSTGCTFQLESDIKLDPQANRFTIYGTSNDTGAQNWQNNLTEIEIMRAQASLRNNARSVDVNSNGRNIAFVGFTRDPANLSGTYSRVTSNTVTCASGKVFKVSADLRWASKSIVLTDTTPSQVGAGNPESTSDLVCALHHLNSGGEEYIKVPQNQIAMSGGEYEQVANSYCEANPAPAPSPAVSPSRAPGENSPDSPAAQTGAGTDSPSTCKFYRFPGTLQVGSWYIFRDSKWLKIDSTGNVTTTELEGNYTEAPNATGKPNVCNGDAGTVGANNPTTAQWKCLIKTPLTSKWYYLNTNSKWESEDHSTLVNLTDSGVTDGSCTTTKPATVPSNAYLAPQALTDAGLSRDPNVAVAGQGEPQSQQPVYQNKLAFTAYRTSYIEPNQMVPVGGVKFTITGRHRNINIGQPQSIMQIQNFTSVAGKQFVNNLQCGTMDNILASIPFFGGYTSSDIKTPDQGPVESLTQLTNVQPGFYKIATYKDGFQSASACFQISENDGVQAPIAINVMMLASVGAEPPGITSGLSTVIADQTIDNHRQYRTGGNDNIYKYLPDAPWYGWQRDNQGDTYNNRPPIGVDGNGFPVSGIQPAWGGIADYGQYLSQCQNYGISVGNMDRQQLGWLGALIGFVDGVRDDASTGTILGRTAMGAAVGLGLGTISGDSGVNISINIGELNRQCQNLQNPSIPQQCQICFAGGSFNPDTCPASCIASNPALQAMMQSRFRDFNSL